MAFVAKNVSSCVKPPCFSASVVPSRMLFKATSMMVLSSRYGMLLNTRATEWKAIRANSDAYAFPAESLAA